MTETNVTAENAAQTDAEQMDVAAIVEVFKQRTATYGLLSRLFRKEIDDELLQELHDSHYRVNTGNANVDEGHRLIATYLSGLWENTQTELAADYMRVFFGHGYNGHAAAYPFESVYTSEKRLLMQSARDEVLALYRSAGLDKQESWKEGEDHMALELEYMQILSGRVVDQMLKGNTVDSLVMQQHNFMEDHLSDWAPLLCADMRSFSKTDFYRGLAYLTEGFLENDRELLAELVKEAKAEAE